LRSGLSIFTFFRGGNRAPVAQADSISTPTATAITINVLANDSDPDGDTLSVTSFTQPAHGSVALVTGGLRYTPVSGFAGSDAFTYTISDGRGGTATTSVSITVQPPANRAPLAQGDSVSTPAGTAVTINVLANDSDPDGDTLGIAGFTQAVHGSVALVSSGLRYTPFSGYTGADSITYTVSDGRGGTATGLASITVLPAAAVIVTVTNGKLAVSGSAGRDVVSITGTGNGMTGQYVVTTGQGSQTISGVTGDIEIDLSGGDDELVINNAFINGSLIILAGGGNDVVKLGLGETVSTRLDLNVSLGDGDDRIDGKRLYIGQNQTIDGGLGQDALSFLGAALPGSFVLGTSSSGATLIRGGAGPDSLSISYSFVVGSVTLDGEAGDDQIDIRTSAAIGSVAVAGAEGSDKLVIDTNYFLTSTMAGGGDGSDQIELRNSLGITIATIDAGSGADAVAVSNLIAGRLSMILGSEGDSADVRSSLFDELFGDLGDGNDSITLYGNLIRRVAVIDGGFGGNLLNDLGNSYLGGLRRVAI
jgi:hypothetical protein